MKLRRIYEETVKIGIENDPRPRKEIEALFSKKKEEYRQLSEEKKIFFDEESLRNPFPDTRIVYGDPEAQIEKILVGIDIDTSELLLAHILNKGGEDIDLVLSHHPAGRALVSFYEVMDLQVDVLSQKGLNISLAEKLLLERKQEVERKISGSNFSKAKDAAELLRINFMCAHTPADNLAYRFLERFMRKLKPRTLKDIVESLLDIPEYAYAARNSCPPRIINGSPSSRVRNIHYEFTGGTEGPKTVYERLSQSGVDTIIAMHLSEEHFQLAKKFHLNVVLAGHISSDSLGVNLLLDRLEKISRLEILNCSGFKRFPRKK